MVNSLDIRTWINLEIEKAGIDPLTHARRLITGLAIIGSVSVKRRLQTTERG